MNIGSTTPSPEEIRQIANLSRYQALAGNEAEARLALIDKLRERRFDYLQVPAPAKPRILIQGKTVATAGNLTAIIAQAKSGKTAFIGAIAAARLALESGNTDRDFLGVSVPPDAHGKLLWIDTEQSVEDFDAVVRRAIRRSGLEQPPENLVAYGCAGFSAAQLRLTLNALLWHTSLDGVFAVILDGVADLCRDVNDGDEANALVAELHASAIKYDCPIICVLHENPSQDSGKARGHLGSQLERKAEANLRLKKSDGTTTVFSERMRRAPILESEGPRFAWSDEAQMHVTVQSLGVVRETAKMHDLRDLAEEVIGNERKRYADVVRAIQEARGVAPKTAEKRFAAMKSAGLIAKDFMGHWCMTSEHREAA